MKQLGPEYLQRPHIRAVLGDEARPESPHRAWPIPARIDQAVLATGRTLFAGDAAAPTGVMPGEGDGRARPPGLLPAGALQTGGLAQAAVTRQADREGTDGLRTAQER